jgi:hypothetical protein
VTALGLAYILISLRNVSTIYSNTKDRGAALLLLVLVVCVVGGKPLKLINLLSGRCGASVDETLQEKA